MQQISGILRRFSPEEQRLILEQLMPKKEGIPISAFRCGLSGLEIVVRYMKEVDGKKNVEVARLLNRSATTIHTTYTNALRKYSGALDVSDYSVVIPVAVVAERSFSVLEGIVVHLNQTFSLKEIAALIHRSYSTVKTVRKRAQMRSK